MVWQTRADLTTAGKSHLELARYFMSSLVALFVDLGVFSFMLRVLGSPWYWAATLGFVGGVVTVYAMSIGWVFSERRMGDRPGTEFAHFVAIGCAGLGLTQGVLWIGIERLHLFPEIVKVCAAGATFAFNFVLRKTLLFRYRKG